MIWSEASYCIIESWRWLAWFVECIGSFPPAPGPHLPAPTCAPQERCTKLEDELTHLTGQQNLNQRIQYHKKIKDENGALREELGRLRIEAHRSQVGWQEGVP